MGRQKLLSTAIFLAVFASFTVFYVYPKYQALSKLFYILVLVGFALWQYTQRNLRAVIICSIGCAFLLLTLPNAPRVRELEVALLFILWGVAAYLFRRAKKRAKRALEDL